MLLLDLALYGALLGYLDKVREQDVGFRVVWGLLQGLCCLAPTHREVCTGQVCP